MTSAMAAAMAAMTVAAAVIAVTTMAVAGASPHTGAIRTW